MEGYLLKKLLWLSWWRQQIVKPSRGLFKAQVLWLHRWQAHEADSALILVSLWFLFQKSPLAALYSHVPDIPQVMSSIYFSLSPHILLGNPTQTHSFNSHQDSRKLPGFYLLVHFLWQNRNSLSELILLKVLTPAIIFLGFLLKQTVTWASFSHPHALLQLPPNSVVHSST